MTKLQKIIAVIFGVVVVLLIGSVAVKQNNSVGGVYSNVTKDFSEGISVDGTTIINEAGTFVGKIATTIASTVGSVGAGANVTVPILAPTADTTLTVAQSGSIIQMGTAGLDVTLPAATSSAGVSYKFVVSAAVATTDMTIVGSAADLIEGSLIVAGAVVDCDAADIITFVIDGENIGDYVELYSDGTKWMIGSSGALTASKMTCTG